MDVAHVEMVEAELDRMIERRASREPDPDTREESYMESVRRYHEREPRNASGKDLGFTSAR